MFKHILAALVEPVPSRVVSLQFMTFQNQSVFHFYGQQRRTIIEKVLVYCVLCCTLMAAGTLSAQDLATLKGRLLEPDGKTGVPFAQVAIFAENADETDPTAFASTDMEGRFTMQAPNGRYSLECFMLGYEDKKVEGIDLKGNLDLGAITLTTSGTALDEVVIEGRQAMMKTTVEGITINPQQNLSNLGGTLLDILRNTPSVSVGDDGSITLRGSAGTNVLINGRNSSLTQNLDRIPASAIEQIKIINNPNARYDAEAEAGIIDIILKQGGNLGTNVGVDALYGTRGRMSTGVQLNHRTLKYNVYGGYNLRRWRSISERRVEREIFGDGELLRQQTNSTDQRLDHTFNYGADYYFGKNIISYEGLFSSKLDEEVNTLYSNLTAIDAEALLLQYVRRNDENETDDGFDNALSYERTFDDKRRSFKFAASQSYTNQFKTQNIDIFRNVNAVPEAAADDRERAIIDEKRFNYVFQADYIHPLSENVTVEAGLKSNIRNFTYDFDFSRFSEADEVFLDDPAVSNEFDYQDRIHAAYMVLSRTSAKWDVTAGLRGEYTDFNTFLYNTGEANEQRYFNLFPSVQTLYKFAKRHGAKFTYSRRIDRPTAWRLNPFPDVTDSLSVRRGNPNLQPELINSLELGHIYEGSKWSLTTNFFYRQVDGKLDYISIVEDGITYSQPANLNSAQSYGVELIGIADLYDWWNVAGSVTGFNIRVDGSNLSDEFTNNGWAYNTKLTSEFKLPLELNLQCVFNYESAEIEAQGRDLEVYYLDVNLQRSFFENRASLSLSAQDVFDTRRFAGNSLTNTFSQEFYRKRETRILLLSARYSF